MKRSVVLFALAAAVGCTRESEVTVSGTESVSTTTVTATTEAPPRAGGATQTAAETPALPRVGGHKLMPVDEGSSDPSFAAFRSGLLDAVRQRDETRLMNAVDPKIRTSFGDGGGTAAFRKQWTPEKQDSPVWSELEFILSNGGTFLENAPAPSFWAPYVYSSWPDGFDAFEHGAIVGENVTVRASASDDAKAVALLSYNIVKLSPPKTQSDPWREIETSDGHKGWVKRSEVRSPIGYRAGFVKNGGEWKMNALVAGD